MSEESEDHCPICNQDLNEGPCKHLAACWDTLSGYPDETGGFVCESCVLDPLHEAVGELNEVLEDAEPDDREAVLGSLAASGMIPATFIAEVRDCAWPGIGHFEDVIVKAIESAAGFVTHTSFIIDRGPGFSEQVNSWFTREPRKCHTAVRAAIKPVVKLITQSLAKRG